MTPVDPVIEQLRSLASKLLIERLDRMFDGADDLLFEMAGRASTNAEQRVFFDTMRIVRLNRPTIVKVFRKEVEASFDPQPVRDDEEPVEAIEVDALTLQESSSLEKSIALSNMATKAEGQYKEALFELRRRLRWLADARQLPVSAEAIQPQQICEAFASSTASLDVEFATELVIYKLFDRVVIGDLGDLYARTLTLVRQLTQQMPTTYRAGGPVGPVRPGPAPAGAPPQDFGYDPASSPPMDAPGAQPYAPGGPAYGAPQPGYGAPAAGFGAPGVPAGYAPGPQGAGYGVMAPPPGGPTFTQTLGPTFAPTMPAPGAGSGSAAMMLDPQTLSSLERVSTAESSGAMYTDGRLAQDIALASQGQPVQGWGVQQAAAYVQRAGLVGRMFNSILSDPSLPADIKPRFDDLRMSVIKSALKDAGFFADPKHPVRGLVNEVAEMAASARAAGADALKRIEDLVSEIQKQFDVAAESVRKPPDDAALIVPEQADKFLGQQLAESERRRRAIIAKVKRIVAEEQQLRVLGRRIPPSVTPLIESGWAPMMAMRLLRHGLESQAWVQGLELLEQLLDAVDPRGKVMSEDALRRLSDDLRSELLGAGLDAQRVERLLKGLSTALAERPTPITPDAGSVETPFGAVSTADFSPAESAADSAPPPDGASGHGGETAPAAATATADASADAAPASPPAPVASPDSVEELIDRLIVPGSWFRVFDRELDDSRWLRVVARYEDSNRVSFSDFNGHQHWFIDTQELVADLLDGRAGPIDFTPAAKRTLDQLRERFEQSAAH